MIDTKTNISDLGLSARAENSLHRAKIHTLEDLLDYDRERLPGIRNLGAKTYAEVIALIERYEEQHSEQRLDDQASVLAEPSIQEIEGLSLQEMLREEGYREKILAYVKANDAELSSLGLSVRAMHVMDRYGYKKMSDILLLTKMELMTMKNMGITTANEICDTVQYYLTDHEAGIRFFCRGIGLSDEAHAHNFENIDRKTFEHSLDEETIQNLILGLYKDIGFAGLSMRDLQEKLSEKVSLPVDVLKRNIGKLLAAGELEYVDYRCYRIYPRFTDLLQDCPKVDERSRDMFLRRLKKETLESVAQDYGLTRERVRQLAQKTFRTVRSWNSYCKELSWFDEDYYRYFFTNYAFATKDAEEWLGIPSYVFVYFDMLGEKQGKKPLTEALEDVSEIDPGLRLKIRNYLNRDNLLIDGRWIPLNRGELEEVVAQKYCRDERSFSDFAKLYNRFLEKEEVPFNEKLYYTDDVIRTRYNRLAEARFLLWKQGSMLRYYDIDARDYTELLDELDLDSFENVEISSAKLFREHPEIMLRYDIRDKYELHNLLKKIVPEGTYHGIEFERNPMITFGTFDRDEAIRRIMFENAPISVQDLATLIEDEYGYDPATTMGSYLVCIDRYKVDDMYVVDQKPMDPHRMAALQEALPNDFYYTEEVEEKYLALFPDADLAEINTYTLKSMGFQVYSNCVLKGRSSLLHYFQSILTANDYTDARAYKERYGKVITGYQILFELEQDLQIVEYEPDKLISHRRLEAAGVTKDVIRGFCNEVYSFVDDNTYFTARSLQEDGFRSSLYDLGFSDWFYANLLLSDPRFSFSKMLGTIVLYKGDMNITRKSFFIDRVKAHRLIDHDDLIDELEEHFGCKVASRSLIPEMLQNTEVYYDRNFDRCFASKDLFYQMLEEEETE